MNFLDEGTFVGRNAVDDAMKDPEFKALKSDEKQKAIAKLKAGGSVTTEKKGKDLDGDGDIDSDDYLAARDKAIKKAMGKEVEESKLSKTLGGVAVLATLLGLNKAASEKIYKGDSKIKSLTTQYEKAKEDGDKTAMAKFEKEIKNRKTQIDTGKIDEADLGSKIGDTLFGKSYDRPFSNLMDTIKDLLNKYKTTSPSDDSKLILKIADIEKGNMPQNEFNSVLRQLKKAGLSRKELKELEKRYKDARKAKQDKEKKKPTNEGNCGCGQTPCKTYGKMKEAKEEEFDYKAPKDTDKDDIKIDPDTKFTVDLKHLIQKHMKEGKSKEDTIKFTKALMAKLHNKGEVTVDGTKIIFKELDAPQDMQMALPEPKAMDYLGADNMDYEGGMAKSQMLKMKNYAKALCDMIDDESQLESWVQAKLTKASDYMSSVYHYLDYQRSKMNEDLNLNPRTMDTDEALVSILMGRGLGEESAEQVIDGLSNEDFKKAGLMMIKGIDERQIAKFILSATTLDENK